MKIYRYMAVFAAALAAVFACQPKENVDFVLDSDTFEVGADGGTATIEVTSPGSWIASANVPWITVSPANGNGSQTCRIIVDSAIVMKDGADQDIRRGTVTIEADNWETRDIAVTQQNYGYTIAIEDTEIDVPDYEALADRYFNVDVKSNVKFDISFLDEEGNPVDWISEAEDNPVLDLNKGARPRNVSLRFDWDINSQPSGRIASVCFTPVDDNGTPINPSESLITRIDQVQVTQTSAAAKPTDPRAADSSALVAIARALNVWSGGWDTSVRMERWEDVDLWEEGDLHDGKVIDESWIGRVRGARFFMFNTDDGIPYQVSWLDAAESLEFYSNENHTFRENINVGEYLLELGGDESNLKRLTIAAYGLDNNSFPDTFFTQDGTDGGKPTFPNLESLDLSSNKFQYIDKRFNQRNFPKLHAFSMRNNQIHVIYDLSNATTSGEQFAEENGGLYRENLDPENQVGGSTGRGFPLRLLRWENLDTLELTLNYLEGPIPTDDEVRAYLGSVTDWTHNDDVTFVQNGEESTINISDSLAVSGSAGAQAAYDAFDALQVPKVLPRLRVFSLNMNRLSGALDPDTHKWLMYHPLMDWWEPSTFIFNQEGTDSNGNTARFTGVPAAMDYYYDIYTNKRFAN